MHNVVIVLMGFTFTCLQLMKVLLPTLVILHTNVISYGSVACDNWVTNV